MAARGQKVVIQEREEKWRYRCPNGHANWDTTNSHIWCPSCSRQHDADPEHFQLLDRKTGREVSRDEIQLEV